VSTQGLAKTKRGVTKLDADQWKGRTNGNKCCMSRVKGGKKIREFSPYFVLN